MLILHNWLALCVLLKFVMEILKSMTWEKLELILTEGDKPTLSDTATQAKKELIGLFSVITSIKLYWYDCCQLSTSIDYRCHESAL